MNNNEFYKKLTDEEVILISGGIIPESCYGNPRLADQCYNTGMTFVGFICGTIEGIVSIF
ncbi:hypothetical protein [Bacteroides sp.]|uniref:hypothetical protein n=1 Tax=Bacteroides sp. TaxID=29523 RepID=UPI002622B589|nr:hypothetical protein [Bacteroides sp.]